MREAGRPTRAGEMRHSVNAGTDLWKTYPRIASIQRPKTSQQKSTANRFALIFTSVVALFLVFSLVALSKMSNFAKLSSPAEPIHSKMQILTNLRLQAQPSGSGGGEEKSTTSPPSSPPPPPPPLRMEIERLFRIGAENATRLLQVLTEDDPFGVSGINDANDFKCPSDISQRIDFPSLIDDTNAQKFRNNEPGAFIFYQHLRKAGGTGFCELAKSNMAHGSVPPYYCMPDNRGSLATPPWSEASYLLEKMNTRGWKLAANEWDVYYDKHARIPGAVLATTFRHPVDRWYSQYRFEHLEHRDGSDANSPRNSFYEYYKGMMGWTMNTNYYVTTFFGEEDKHPPANKGDFYWTYHKFWKKPITLQMFLKSVENVRKFNLLLVTEFLDYSVPLLDEVLGWKVPPKQVLPHEVQAMRAVKKNIPASARMAPDVYAAVCRDNVFDLLLFDLVKRIFLERYACKKAAATDHL